MFLKINDVYAVLSTHNRPKKGGGSLQPLRTSNPTGHLKPDIAHSRERRLTHARLRLAHQFNVILKGYNFVPVANHIPGYRLGIIFKVRHKTWLNHPIPITQLLAEFFKSD
jgi:hypothetical protein